MIPHMSLNMFLVHGRTKGPNRWSPASDATAIPTPLRTVYIGMFLASYDHREVIQ